MTTTNVADARDLYNFRRTDLFYTSTISFRVRAQRKLYGEVVSGLPVTSWGPWSPIVQRPSASALGRDALDRRIGVGRPVGRRNRSAPRPHTGLRVRRRQRRSLDYIGGAPARALPRLRRDGQGLRQHRLHRRRRRQPRVRAEDDRAAAATAGLAGDREGTNEVARDRQRAARAHGRRHRLGDERDHVRRRRSHASRSRSTLRSGRATPGRHGDRGEGRPARHCLADRWLLLDRRSRRAGAAVPGRGPAPGRDDSRSSTARRSCHRTSASPGA